MKTIKIRLTFVEEVLGTCSADKEIHERFIASKAPDAPKLQEEVEALGAEAVAERGTTIFPKTAGGVPFLWDYQIKGFFKDACGCLRKVSDTRSAKLRAYKKDIDGLIFPVQRRIELHLPEGGEMGSNQRPLRASTPQGERVALVSSESMPSGTWCEFEVSVLRDDLMPIVREWLAYGRLRGIGQWRNSGCGRFKVEYLDERPFSIEAA